MELVKYELELPKESKEVIDLLAELVVILRSDDRNYAELLPKLMVALDGAGKIGDELKGSHKDELAAYLLHKVGGPLLK